MRYAPKMEPLFAAAEPSLITSMKPARCAAIVTSLQCWYNVDRDEPCTSSENASSQCSSSCNRGGMSSRISSASDLVRSKESAPESGRSCRSSRAVKGGGWKGDAVRLGGV